LKFGEPKPRKILRGGGDGLALSTGHLIFRRDDTLMAVPFDLTEVQNAATAVPLLEGIGAGTPGSLAQVAVSTSGTLIYRAKTGGDNSDRLLALVEHNGTVTPLSSVRGDLSQPRFSLDGTQVAITIRKEKGDKRIIHILRLDRDLLRPLTTEQNDASASVWSPDGKWIYFAAVGDGGKSNLYRIVSGIGGKAERLTTSDHNQIPVDISPDGNYLAITQETAETRTDVLVLHLDESGHIGGEPRTIAASPAWDGNARFSSDSKWIAYTSNEYGSFQVYVKALDGNGAPVQISTEGGRQLRWSTVERRLYFTKSLSSDEVFSVSYSTEDNVFRPAPPEKVFKLDHKSLQASSLEISPDGERFLITCRAEQTPDVWASRRIIVNWFEDLKARVPID